MLLLESVDLHTDPLAQTYAKSEVVEVQFADRPGQLMSLEGSNRYERGDALITAASGERWVVSRDRFDLKYVPDGARIQGHNGAYRNRPSSVLARRMDEAFSILRSAQGDRLEGQAGDWLMQYAVGDYGITRDDRFQRVYHLVGQAG